MTDVVQASVLVRFSPPGACHGTLRVPGDKSISHRYAMLGAIAEGTTDIAHLAPGDDVATTLACLQALGAAIERHGPLAVRITGCGCARARGGRPAPLDAGNSGHDDAAARGHRRRAIRSPPCMTGDASLSRRPMTPRRSSRSPPWARAFARTTAARPSTIHGGALTGIAWTPPVASAQVKSALLLAGLRAQGTTTVVESAADTRSYGARVSRVRARHFASIGRRVSVRGRPGGPSRRPAS